MTRVSGYNKSLIFKAWVFCKIKRMVPLWEYWNRQLRLWCMVFGRHFSFMKLTSKMCTQRCPENVKQRDFIYFGLLKHLVDFLCRFHSQTVSSRLDENVGPLKCDPWHRPAKGIPCQFHRQSRQWHLRKRDINGENTEISPIDAKIWAWVEIVVSVHTPRDLV